jgi:hypothetical protein
MLVRLLDVEDLTFSKTLGSQMAVRLSALLVGHALPPERFSCIYFCERLSKCQSHSVARKIR